MMKNKTIYDLPEVNSIFFKKTCCYVALEILFVHGGHDARLLNYTIYIMQMLMYHIH